MARFKRRDKVTVAQGFISRTTYLGHSIGLLVIPGSEGRVVKKDGDKAFFVKFPRRGTVSIPASILKGA